jgi:hypothetical protein
MTLYYNIVYICEHVPMEVGAFSMTLVPWPGVQATAPAKFGSVDAALASGVFRRGRRFNLTPHRFCI